MSPENLPQYPFGIPTETAMFLWNAQLAWQEKVGWVIPLEPLSFSHVLVDIPENDEHLPE